MGSTPSALRALCILETLTNSTEPLTLTELMHYSKIPKTSLLRNISLLVQAGYVIRLPGQLGYTVGARSLRLSANALRSSWFLNAARKTLKRLVQSTSEACNLTMLSEDSVQYLVREDSNAPWSLRLHVQPNAPVPLHCTASGKLFLAYLPYIEQKKYLNRLNFATYGENSITDMQRLKTELENTRRQGFGVDNEEFVTGMIAIAVPIFAATDSSQVIAAIACHAVTARTDLRKLLSYRAMMSQAATEISELLAANLSPQH